MPKRKVEDINEAAFRVVRESTSEPIPITSVKRRKNPAAVALGRAGGKKSGKARMEKLTPEQRSNLQATREGILDLMAATGTTPSGGPGGKIAHDAFLKMSIPDATNSWSKCASDRDGP